MKKFLVCLYMMFMCASYADTETIEWYVDGTLYDTTSCQTGGDINLPTPPTKTDYTFVGWEIPTYDFSTLDYTIGGDDYRFDLSAHTWATTFSYGIVNGVSLCSVTPGSYAVAGTPDESTVDGQYCWCKATGYTPVSSNIVYEPTSNLAWIFDQKADNASSCASNCTNFCGSHVRIFKNLRQSIFGITQ